MTKQEENVTREETENVETHEFKHKISGQKALDRLYKELDDKGLLVDPEQDFQSTKELLDRVTTLENEVNMLKDLIARALKVDTGKVLKD